MHWPSAQLAAGFGFVQPVDRMITNPPKYRIIESPRVDRDISIPNLSAEACRGC